MQFVLYAMDESDYEFIVIIIEYITWNRFNGIICWTNVMFGSKAQWKNQIEINWQIHQTW